MPRDGRDRIRERLRAFGAAAIIACLPESKGTKGLAASLSNSNHRRHALESDEAGQRAHFALLVLAQLEQ